MADENVKDTIPPFDEEEETSDDDIVTLLSADGEEIDFVEIAGLDSIKLHANMDTPEINFDIHTYVFIENGEIYIFELRTLDVSGESERQFKNIIQSFKILK